MITDYLRDDVWFNSEYADQQQTTGTTSAAVSDAIKALKGDDEEATPYKGTDQKRLDELFKTGVIDEATYRAELKARKMGQATIDDKVKANAPDPNAVKASQIKPPSMQGGAGLADYSEMSETDILNKVKKGEWTPEQAEDILVSSKGYSAGSAMETVNAVRPAVKTAAQSAAERALETRGITSKLSESDIMKGAEQGLWTPDEAYRALVTLKGYSETEAATTLRLRGWKGGPGGTAPAAKPPIAGSPGELMSQYRNAAGETPADTPGALMARQARPVGSPAAAGEWVVSGAEKANPNMTYTRQGGTGGGLTGVMTPKVQTPTVQGQARTAASGTTGKTPAAAAMFAAAQARGEKMVRAEDGSLVPESYWGRSGASSGKREDAYITVDGVRYVNIGGQWVRANNGLASVV